MNPTKVLIVDDHQLLRGGIRLLVNAQPDMKVVGEAGNLLDAVELAAKVSPDIITLDLSMPGPSGVASVERLKRAAPSARIVVLTMHDDPAYVRTAAAMGAMGYVVKSAADTELIAAIRAVARGRVFFDAGDRATLAELFSQSPGRGAAKTPIESLSPRELEVLREVASGHTNQAASDKLGLSVKTVESYRARLMKKLGLKERADLVRLAVEMGLLSSDRPPAP